MLRYPAFKKMFGLWTFILDRLSWEYLISNCSTKTIEEWKLESMPNLPLASFYIAIGVIFEVKKSFSAKVP